MLAQLGSRIQHALRAHTPRDAKALKAAVTTYPKTDDYDLEEDLTRLGTGEAMVTLLDEKGVPTPVVWTRLRPRSPASATSAAPRSTRQPRRARAGASTRRWRTLGPPRRQLAGAIAAAKADDGPNVRVEKPSAKASRRGSTSTKKDGPGWFGRFWTSREGRSMISTFFRWLLSFFSRGR